MADLDFAWVKLRVTFVNSKYLKDLGRISNSGETCCGFGEQLQARDPDGYESS